MHRAYVQRRSDRLVCPSNTAADGLAKLGYEVVWFDEADADKLELSPDTLVVGFIEVCRNALKKITGKEVPVFNYPDELGLHLGRKIVRHTIKQVRNSPQMWPIFIKPEGTVKAFTGKVVKSVIDLIATKGLADDELVWASEVVKFESEFRCFIKHGKVIGCRHYKGEPLTFPIEQEIQEMVAHWKSSPAAYCLDVGVIRELPEDMYGKEYKRGYRKTLLVEINDAYSAGDYGLDPLLYARFLEARWCELTGATPIP